MKFMKVLGLAAIAAAALMAFVGAGTASAAPNDTVLCKTTTLPCTGHYPVGTTIHAELATGTATLKAGFATITCKKSTVQGKTATTTTPEGNIEVLTFTECGEAKVVVLKKGKLQIHHTGGHVGNLTVSGVEVTVEVGGVSCTYGGTISTGLTVTGGAPASMVANEASIPKVAGGFLCANPSKWTAHYKVTTPNPLYISTETL